MFPFFKILNRISANMSLLSLYPANDDELEPALMFVCEALWKGPNLQNSLHYGSMASNSLMYH